MFERFTERSRQVVVYAQEEARTLRHNSIGTEHLLLGILREDKGLAARALHALDISLERARGEVVRLLGTSEERPSGQIPFTPDAKKALEQALHESLSLEHNYIGTEHLLLGLLDDEESGARSVMQQLGVNPEHVRDEVKDMLPEGGERPSESLSADFVSADGVEAAFDPRARQLLMVAAARALDARREAIGPGDLLIALISDETLGSVLASLGVDVHALRQRLPYMGWSEPEAPEE
jgi:ATP-dependent Clp protease ATP-binding subunit ClpC